MKKIVFSAACTLFAMTLAAQQKEGKVIYERTLQMQVNISDNNEMAQMMPRTRKDKFVLSYGNNQSLWKHEDEEINNDEASGNGVQIKMVGPGQNDVVFQDFTTGKKVEQRDMMDKKFIIEDSVKKLNWKLTGETQTVMGHLCSKAIAQRIGKRMQMSMDNGKMERKEISDTSNLIAWFTNDIPISAGPEVAGQLPGLILSLDINNGRMVYTAMEISGKTDVAAIKPPTKGKKVTLEEYRAETSKMMEEMEKNNQGNGKRVIKIN